MYLLLAFVSQTVLFTRRAICSLVASLVCTVYRVDTYISVTHRRRHGEEEEEDEATKDSDRNFGLLKYSYCPRSSANNMALHSRKIMWKKGHAANLCAIGMRRPWKQRKVFRKQHDMRRHIISFARHWFLCVFVFSLFLFRFVVRRDELKNERKYTVLSVLRNFPFSFYLRTSTEWSFMRRLHSIQFLLVRMKQAIALTLTLFPVQC